MDNDEIKELEAIGSALEKIKQQDSNKALKDIADELLTFSITCAEHHFRGFEEIKNSITSKYPNTKEEFLNIKKELIILLNALHKEISIQNK